MESSERTLTQLNGQLLDITSSMFRARQRIGEAERDQLEFADNRRHDAMTQLQETRRRLELEAKREAMLIGLAAESGVSPVDLPLQTRMRVRRAENGEVSVLQIGPDDLIRPGDVFEIELSFELAPG